MAQRVTPAALDDLLGRSWRRPGESAYALADGLRALVVNGRVAARTRVPSERELSSRLGISRGSVSRAYDRLREEGYLTSRRGAGSWLTLPEGSGPVLEPYDAPDGINLTWAALPAPDPLLARAATRAAGALPRLLHTPGYDAAGVPELREAIAARLTERGLDSRADQVLVTAGAQHALHLLLTLLAGPGDRVLVDAPAYPRTLAAIRTARARALAVPLTPTGWDVGAWEATLAAGAPPLAVTVADFHNPTGLTMRAADRAALARACARAGTLLVVDETFAELRLDGPALPPPVGAHDPGATVVTIGTMSKSAWGGLRVGWIRASRRLVSELASVRASLDMAGPVLDQLLALELLGDWDAVLADRRELLTARRDALLGALPAEWVVRKPHGGMSAWVQLPAPVATRLAGIAATRGLAITPGPAFSVDGTFESHLRLPFTLPPEDLRSAAERLAELAANLTERLGGADARMALAV
jgi:DNA-binding transcriptional MocR family regulator